MVAVAALAAALAPSFGCHPDSRRNVWAEVSGRRLLEDVPGLARASSDSAGVDATAAASAEDIPWPEGVLTREDAHRIALRHSPDVHAAAARLAAAAARVGQAQAEFWPTVALLHTSRRTFHTPANRNRLQTAVAPAPLLAADPSAGPLNLSTIINALRLPLFGSAHLKGDRNSFSEHSSSFSAVWTLYDGFARDARLAAALDLQRASVWGQRDIERILGLALDTAYHQAQLAAEELRIAEADEAFSLEQLEVTKKMAAAEKVTAADVGNFELRVTAARASVIAAVGARDAARVTLAELMGLPDCRWPEGLQLAPLDSPAFQLQMPDVEAWIERALRDRADLAQLNGVLDAERENLRAAVALYQPDVTLSASWGYDNTSNLRYTVQDQASAAGLEFRWDLFTGGARRHRVMEAQARVAEARALVQRKELQIAADVRAAIINLVNARQQVELGAQRLEIAVQNRGIVQAGYAAGKESLTRLNEAQRDYINADAELALARIRLRQALSDLYAAAGSNGSDEAGAEAGDDGRESDGAGSG